MKGQYFSFDAIIASVIFVLALVALLSYWHSVKSFLDYQGTQLSKDAVRISNLLFTPPSPPSSSCASMDRLGLSMGWDDKRVNADVLDCASRQDQQWLRERLGTAYNVSIRVTPVDEPSSAAIIIGDTVPSDVDNAVNMRRLATVFDPADGSTYMAKVDLTLYQ